ncbi:uncharacterized protein METZ01_LOCUS285055 [marine metagenome]|uniref:Uncharacterized protein n=1 Tax=marine metagenome TaxID=408172 RepID=A0A382LBG1_9ZZZZ
MREIESNNGRPPSEASEGGRSANAYTLGDTGDLEQVSVATGIENPSFLALDPSNMKMEIAQWHWRTEYEG